jgi:hypothetical protein
MRPGPSCRLDLHQQKPFAKQGLGDKGDRALLSIRLAGPRKND